jgi:hypothetical protein
MKYLKSITGFILLGTSLLFLPMTATYASLVDNGLPSDDGNWALSNVLSDDFTVGGPFQVTRIDLWLAVYDFSPIPDYSDFIVSFDGVQVSPDPELVTFTAMGPVNFISPNNEVNDPATTYLTSFIWGIAPPNPDAGIYLSGGDHILSVALNPTPTNPNTGWLWTNDVKGLPPTGSTCSTG